MRYISRQIEALLGFTAEEWQRVPDRWCRQLHADDRERVLAASAQTRTTGAPFQAEYRLLAQDGRVVWVLDQAVVVEEVGQRFMLQGVMLDITARKQAEEASAAKAALLLRLSEALRTHMQGLLDGAQALEQTRLSSEQRAGVEQIVAEGQRLRALLEALPETTARVWAAGGSPSTARVSGKHAAPTAELRRPGGVLARCFIRPCFRNGYAT